MTISVAHINNADQAFRTWAYTTVFRAYSSAVASGNLLVAAVWVYPSTTTASLTDDMGNTWAAASYIAAQSNAFNGMCQIFYAVANGDNTPVVTATISSGAGPGNYICLQLMEFTGNHSNPLDGSGLATTGASSAPSGSITTGTDHDLIVVCAVSGSSITGAGNNYTDVSHTNAVSYERLEFRLDAGTAGSVTADFTGSGSFWALAAAAFKVASSSSLRFVKKPTFIGRQAIVRPLI